MKPTRRELLKGLHAAAALGALPILPGASGAPGARTLGGANGKLLVVVFLRGGMDGLNLVVPFQEPEYYRLRPGIAIPPPGSKKGAGKACVELEGGFGLHPRAAALREHFEAGHAAAVLGIGNPKNTRSHFEEQDYWETADPENDETTRGWLNGYLQDVEGAGPLRAVALGGGLPRLLRGPVPTLAIRGLGDLGRKGSSDSAMRRALEASSERTNDLWVENARATLDTLAVVREALAEAEAPRAEYPNDELARRLSEVARLRRAGLGLEVAALDYGGWDTHKDQGGVEGGYANRVGALAGGLDAFLRDMEDELEDVCVLCVSEFGRTAFENGTGGTDHGQGNVALVLGGGLRGGAPLAGEWPGLEPEQLNKRRDLRVTVDFRDLVGEVLGKHLGHPDPASLLGRPESSSLPVF